jgi:hypothetical protein
MRSMPDTRAVRLIVTRLYTDYELNPHRDQCVQSISRRPVSAFHDGRWCESGAATMPGWEGGDERTKASFTYVSLNFAF